MIAGVLRRAVARVASFISLVCLIVLLSALGLALVVGVFFVGGLFGELARPGGGLLIGATVAAATVVVVLGVLVRAELTWRAARRARTLEV